MVQDLKCLLRISIVLQDAGHRNVINACLTDLPGFLMYQSQARACLQVFRVQLDHIEPVFKGLIDIAQL